MSIFFMYILLLVVVFFLLINSDVVTKVYVYECKDQSDSADTAKYPNQSVN